MGLIRGSLETHSTLLSLKCFKVNYHKDKIIICSLFPYQDIMLDVATKANAPGFYLNQGAQSNPSFQATFLTRATLI